MLSKKLLFALFLQCIMCSVFALSTKAKYAILVDSQTGAVLFEKNASTKMPPSSMSKLMTLYILFEKIKSGALKLGGTVRVSVDASKKGGSRMFLIPGSEVKIQDLIRGIAVQSGNDACITVAEAISGTEEEFARLMNVKAVELGLKNSHFANATGWPHPNHYMTVEDLSILAKRLLVEFPEHYHYFGEKEFSFNNINQGNRNSLLYNSSGVDGFKTGHTDVAGYGLTASAAQGSRRLIAIVNGLKSDRERAEETQKLLNYGFLNFTNLNFAKSKESIAVADVWLGSTDKVSLIANQDLIFTVPMHEQALVKATISYDSYINAPYNTQNKVGVVKVSLGSQGTKEYDLYPEAELKEAGFFSKTWQKTCRFFKTFSLNSPAITEITRSVEIK